MSPEATKTQMRHHSSHWGAFTAEVQDGRFVDARPFEKDPDPSPIIRSMTGALYDNSRVTRPYMRSATRP